VIFGIFGLIYLIFTDLQMRFAQNHFASPIYLDLSDFWDFWIDLPDFQRFTDANRSKPLCVACESFFCLIIQVRIIEKGKQDLCDKVVRPGFFGFFGFLD